MSLKHPEWVAVTRDQDPDGNDGATWLDPANPDVRTFLLEQYRELVEKYDIDGIHLDFIRYAHAAVAENKPDRGYTLVARDALKAQYGKDPIEISPGTLWAIRWNQFREQLITSFVLEVGQMMKSLKPALKLSAAVLGELGSARENRMQNWAE